ncbi:vanadium-dependent haloperoxidase [Salinispora fenicalii]|uniref:vanadium-dependent haloperoxidase n=1 Tax=Salinispora fenicalii TaxID=1137263 RepID=UPI000485D3E6|nr:vanadium-dependent haloperoxidase [Salinispora fenicalii]
MSSTVSRIIRPEHTTAGTAPAPVTHVTNGEENLYPDYLGNFSKGLPHNEFGEVDRSAYRRFVRRLSTEDPGQIEGIELDPSCERPLVNPQAGLSINAIGPRSTDMTIPPAPRMDSAELSAELCELYWMALCRDVPFARLTQSDVAQAAADDLTRLSDYRAVRQNGRVTPGLLFRGDSPGDHVGPYLSQFLWRDIQFGTYRFEQRQDTVRPNQDYMTTFGTYLKVQRGWNRTLAPSERDQENRRFLYSPRALAHWLHFDGGPTPAKAFFHAGLILDSLGAPVDAGNPYADSTSQQGFSTFGTPHLLALVTEVANRALRAVWYQKWFVHRRMRPEVFGARVHQRLSGVRAYEFIDREVLESDAVDRVFSKWGSYLLPQAFPEGSPMHPSYGAGHGTAAAAAATVLKAWFDETAVLDNPVQANEDGTALVPYEGQDAGRLTVGGELNKLAANVGIGRNIAGVHWRTDWTESAKLGESLAIQLLREQKAWFKEPHWFTVTRFDGTTVRF